MARVLIMEDDIELAPRYAAALRAAGHEVDCVGLPEDAKEALETERYDILVSDLYISLDVPKDFMIVVAPDTRKHGGISLIRWVRQQGRSGGAEWLRRMPIIAISGASARAGHRHALPIAQAVGATHVMDKPFSDADLVYAVEQFVDGG